MEIDDFSQTEQLMGSRGKAGRSPKRDMSISGFGEILSQLEESGVSIELAVLFDELGETIDYVSYKDPYLTRLTAAHLGVVFQSVRARLKWLGLGETEVIEIRASLHDSISVLIGGDCFLSVVLKAGELDHRLWVALDSVVAKLREEIKK